MSQETSLAVSLRDFTLRDGSSIQRTVKSSTVGSGMVSGSVCSTIGLAFWGLAFSVGAVGKVCGVTTIMLLLASSPFDGQSSVQLLCLADACLFISRVLLDV